MPACTVTLPALLKLPPERLISCEPVASWFSVPALVNVALPVLNWMGAALEVLRLSVAPAALVSVLPKSMVICPAVRLSVPLLVKVLAILFVPVVEAVPVAPKARMVLPKIEPACQSNVLLIVTPPTPPRLLLALFNVTLLAVTAPLPERLPPVKLRLVKLAGALSVLPPEVKLAVVAVMLIALTVALMKSAVLDPRTLSAPPLRLRVVLLRMALPTPEMS